MKLVKYILVNETNSHKAGSAVRDCHLPDIRHHIIVKAGRLSRGELISRLAGLRRHYPEAKILGLGELGEYRVHPCEAMNGLRREMSELF